MSCDSNVKFEIIDGLLLGLCTGAILGTLDCVVYVLFSRNRSQTNFCSRIANAVVQGGVLGLIFGGVLGFIKYCSFS